MPLFHKLFFSPCCVAEQRFSPGRESSSTCRSCSERSRARRGEIHGIKGREDKRISFLNTVGMTPLWRSSLRSKCAACWEEGWDPAPMPTLHPAPQPPAMSRISTWPLQPWQWRQQGLSWAEVVLMIADYVVFALLYPPQGEKTCFFPSTGVLGLGARGQHPFPWQGWHRHSQ